MTVKELGRLRVADILRRSWAGMALCAAMAWPAFAGPCESVLAVNLARAKINSAEIVPAGAFRLPQGRGSAAAFQDLAAFCRVAATLRPSADSQIGIEVWMPVSGWNGKLQAAGNGAWAGSLSYPAMATALQAGYATASTDTGHTGNTADFLAGHPEKAIDFAYRGVHEMTVAAKTLVAAFYSTGPQYSYWNGCSTGGRQALAEAQRYPNDYDGIVAGAAANYVTHLQGMQVWAAQQAHASEASLISPAKLAALHRAALAACDRLDGVIDGVIEDPRECHFDPKVLACKGGDGPECLAQPQLELAEKLYAGPGRESFPDWKREARRAGRCWPARGRCPWPWRSINIWSIRIRTGTTAPSILPKTCRWRSRPSPRLGIRPIPTSRRSFLMVGNC